MEQENLVKGVINYIELDKNFYSAILIKAHWGAGKTYFVKNILFDKIKDTLKANDKYVVYISLNGVNTINELHSRFNIAKIKFRNKKNVDKNRDLKKESMEIVSAFTEFLSDDNKKRLGVIMKLTNSTIKIKNSMLSNLCGKKFVFILDDIERCTIDIKDLLGCISDMSEQDCCKFIIIGNEEEIVDQERYKKIKEKVIGYTYLFIQDIEELLKNELNDTESLNVKNQFINWLKKRENVNCRVLFQSLNIYQILKKEIKRLNLSYLDDEDNWEDLCIALIKSCYFYKEQHAMPSNELQKPDLKKTLEDFILEYDNKKIEFEFVRIMVENGYFDKSQIEEEINLYVEKEIVLKKDREIKQLENNFYIMEDKEVEFLFEEIIKKVKNNNIDYILYPQVIELYLKFINIGFEFSYNTLDDLVRDLSVNIEDNNTTYGEIRMPHFFDTISETYMEQYKTSIKKLCDLQNSLLLNKSIKIENTTDWVKNLEKAFEERRGLFIDQKAFFEYVDLDSLFKVLFSSKNEKIEDFRAFVVKLERNYYLKNDSVVEDMILRIENYMSENKHEKIKQKILHWLINNLKSYIEK